MAAKMYFGIRPAKKPLLSSAFSGVFSEMGIFFIPLSGYLCGLLLVCRASGEGIRFLTACVECLFPEKAVSFWLIFSSLFALELPVLLLLFLLGFVPFRTIFPELLCFLRAALSGLFQAALMSFFATQGRALLYLAFWIPDGIWLFLLSKLCLRINRQNEAIAFCMYDDGPRPKVMLRSFCLCVLLYSGGAVLLSLFRAALCNLIIPTGL